MMYLFRFLFFLGDVVEDFQLFLVFFGGIAANSVECSSSIRYYFSEALTMFLLACVATL